MQLSTALSDGVLAAVALGGAGWLWLRSESSPQRAGAGGVAIVGAAAAVGMVRYAGLEELTEVHQGLSRLGSLLGMPLIGIGWFWRGTPAAPKAFRPTIAIVALLGLLTEALSVDLWRTVVSGLGMLLVLGVSFYRRGPWSPLGAGGALLVLLSGLAIGTEGSLGGLLRIDLFHLALAGACALLLTGLARLPGAAPLGAPPAPR